MEREPFTSDRLFSPGPTPVPLSVHLASVAKPIYHRSEEFYKIFQGIRADLRPIFGIDKAHEAPLILTNSGTGAMEAAMVNLTQQDDEIITINCGKFGERWAKLGLAYGCKVHEMKVSWGETPRLEDLKDLCGQAKKLKAVFFSANETSAGTKMPVKDIVATVQKAAPNALTVVDAISSLGAHPMKMSDWKIDCVVAGSQKGFGIPPGLAFIALSAKAMASFSKRQRFYFDLERELKEQSTGSTAWTPAITLVMELREALTQMNAVGVDKLISLHVARAKAVRAAVKELNLELLSKNSPSDALSAISLPDKVPGKELLKGLRERFGFVFAGGQDHHKGKLLRFSHLGFIDRFDILSGIAGLEFVLKDMGYISTLGRGVSAAMGSFETPSS